MQAAPAATAAAAAAADREEEAPEYPPPPAYYRLFAPPPPAEGAGADEEEAEEEAEGAASSGGAFGEEDDSFPLPPPALPRKGKGVEVFGFPLAFLDEERYDPIVPPEARLYPLAESTTPDSAVGAGAGAGAGGGGVTVVELDFRQELKRLHGLLADHIPALLLALKTDAAKTPQAPASSGAGAAAGVESPHLALLGEVVKVVDNMHDALSAYRQHQTLVQMVERMEAQCREKRAVIAALKGRIAEGQAAADRASAGLVAALQGLVDGEGR